MLFEVLCDTPCGEGVGDSIGVDDEDVDVSPIVDVIVVVGVTVDVTVTALQLVVLKTVYDGHCGVTKALDTAGNVPPESTELLVKT